MITRESLMGLETYAKTRIEFRKQVMEHKKNRSVYLGNHVTAVEAACVISGSECSGLTVGASELEFRPGRVTPGINRGYNTLDKEGKLMSVTAASMRPSLEKAEMTSASPDCRARYMKVGAKLRAMMPWIGANKLVDKAKN